MEFTTCYCPHPQCTHYGQRGFGTHLVRCGADRGIPRLLCTRCQGTFSVRQGTAYFGVRAEEPNYSRIVEVDKDTICDWVDRAGRHCRDVTTYLFDTLHITECQVDELWSFVRGSCWVSGSYVTSNSMSACSNALPRFLALCTNSKKPR